MQWWDEISDWLSERGPDRLPEVVSALALVVVGYLLARLLRHLTARFLGDWSTRLLGMVGKLSHRAREHQRVEQAAVLATSRIVFWVVFILFVAAAASVVGSSVVSTWLDALARYLPRILGAAAVVLLGVVAGHVARVLVLSAGATAGRAYARSLAKAVQIGVVVVAATVAMEELGIEITFLVVISATLLATSLGGAALAFGLGARDTVANLVACHYLTRSYRVGHIVRVAGTEGRIVDILPTGVLLQTDTGRALIPARRFADDVTVLITGQVANDGGGDAP